MHKHTYRQIDRKKDQTDTAAQQTRRSIAIIFFVFCVYWHIVLFSSPLFCFCIVLDFKTFNSSPWSGNAFSQKSWLSFSSLYTVTYGHLLCSNIKCLKLLLLLLLLLLLSHFMWQTNCCPARRECCCCCCSHDFIDIRCCLIHSH